MPKNDAVLLSQFVLIRLKGYLSQIVSYTQTITVQHIIHAILKFPCTVSAKLCHQGGVMDVYFCHGSNKIPICEWKNTKYTIILSKKVQIKTVKPLTGCFSFCHGELSAATTQEGLSHDAIAANIKMA